MDSIQTIRQKRISVFKANKRGYYSLWVFSFLFIFTLFSEFIANDKPLLISYKSDFYTPIFKTYSEQDFGGDFESEADYRDEYVQELIQENGYIIWPLIRYSFDTIKTDSQEAFPSAPSSENILGTDDQGRDVMARIMYGFRISVLFGLALTIFSSIIGVFVGATQGYYGGKVDLFGQRFIEIWGGLPTLYLLIILANYIQPTFWWLLGLLLMFSWTGLVGVVRAEFLRARNFEYVKAARALGQSDKNIMMEHILPNASGSNTYVYAIYFKWKYYNTYFFRLFRFWTASWKPKFRRAFSSRKGKYACSLAWDYCLCSFINTSNTFSIYR